MLAEVSTAVSLTAFNERVLELLVVRNLSLDQSNII